MDTADESKRLKRRPRLGLWGKVAVAILAAGSIPIVVGLSVAYVNGRAELQSVIGASFRALAEDTASKIDGEIERLVAANRRLAERAGADPALWRTPLEVSETRRLEWPPVAAGDTRTAKLLASWVIAPPLPDDSSTAGPRATVRVSGLQADADSGRYFIDVSTAVIRPGAGTGPRARIGTLVRRYDIKKLLDPLTYPIRFGTTGHVMLIDNSGSIVSCPLLATGSRIQDRDLLARVSGPRPGWVTAGNDGHGGRKFSIIGHAPLRAVNRALENGGSWNMFVWQDSAEIFAPARSFLFGIALAGVLAIGLLGVLGYFASRGIVKPIRVLREEASHIASGELDRPLDIRTGDEIEELAQEFNQMRIQLRQLIGNLEEKVLERTRELEHTQAEKDQVVEQLIQAEKMTAVGTMASGIGHEINNPLYMILGTAEAIRDADELPACREHARSIIDYAKNIAAVVKDLSGYVRPGADQALEPVDVNDKVREAVSMSQRSVLGDTIDIRQRLSPVPGIAAKPDEIRQVFFNIIRNAIQAMSGAGELVVTTGVEDGCVLVEIADNGSGIAAEHQGKIFDPFFTTKGPDEGEGLGLYIVRQIVEKHAGTITVKSEKDAGTVFTIRFPTAA